MCAPKGALKLLFFAVLIVHLLICAQVFPSSWVRHVLQWTSRTLCKRLGVEVKVFSDGDEADFSRGSLVVSNHISYLDVVILSALFPCTFLGKREVQDWWLLGSLAQALRVLFVERESLAHRVGAVRALKTALTSQECVLVFPEGTTTSDIGPSAEIWKSGQLWSSHQSNSQIIAVGLHYKDQKEVAWIGDTCLFPHLWAFLCGSGTKAYVHVEFLASASRLEGSSVRDMSQSLCQKVSSLCEKSHKEALLCHTKPLRSQSLHSQVPV